VIPGKQLLKKLGIKTLFSTWLKTVV